MIILFFRKIFSLILLFSLCGCARITVNDAIDGMSIHRLPKEVVNEVISIVNKELLASLERYKLKSDTILKADDCVIYPMLFGNIYILRAKINLIGKGCANLQFKFEQTKDEKQIKDTHLQYIQQGDLVIDEVLFSKVFINLMLYHALKYKAEKTINNKSKKQTKRNYKIYASHIISIENSNECIWYFATEERIRKFKITFNRKPVRWLYQVFSDKDPINFTIIELDT